MPGKLFFAFLKDKLSLIAGYAFSSAVLILFFNLSAGTAEVLYPSVLALFILCVVLLFQWFQYSGYNRSIARMSDQPEFKVPLRTCEQALHYETLKRVHQNYLRQIGGILEEQRAFKRSLAQWVHQMKTSVSVVDLAARDIKDDSEHAGQGAADILQENSRIAEGLEQVLNWVRLDEFANDYSPVETDLADDAREVVNHRKSQFIYNRVFPKITGEPGNFKVLTDGKWNRVMLDQLISNAIKYSADPAADKSVIIHLAEYEEKIVLTITDEGMGIPEYDLERIFEPFFTGENGRKVRNSSGIGLFICGRIAEGLGHPIEVKSAPGGGTSVSISYLKAQRVG